MADWCFFACLPLAGYNAFMKKLGISDEAVVKATNKRLKEWFKILDKAGAKKTPQTNQERFFILLTGRIQLSTRIHARNHRH